MNKTRITKTVLSCAAVGFVVLLGVTPADAQSHGTAQAPHHPPAAATAPTPAPETVPKESAMPMMDMCRQKMAEMGGMAMMGGSLPSDPKERAHMLQMRGEMMKAMGEVMMKHARRMHAPSGK